MQLKMGKIFDQTLCMIYALHRAHVRNITTHQKMQIKAPREVEILPIEMAPVSRRQTINSRANEI